MDFEKKVSNELPWSQKFRDVWNSTESSFDAGDGIKQVRSFDYEAPDRRFKCFVLHYDRDKGEKGYDFIQIDYRRREQDINGQVFSLQSRVGGPSFYRIVNDEIVEIEYWLGGQRVQPAKYWTYLCTQLVKHYETEWRNNVVYFKSKNGKVPCPYCYIIKRKQFVYKLGKKRVTVSDFWKHWEQRFVNIDLFD